MTDIDIVEFRIGELQHEILRAQEEIDKLEKRKTEIKGAIAELWKWHETLKESTGYGQLQYDGTSKVLKLPVLGSPQAIKDAIEDRGRAIDGEDDEKVKEIRMDKMRSRSKRLIKLMDGRGPEGD